MESASSLQRYYEKRLLPLRKKIASGKILFKEEEWELERISNKFCSFLQKINHKIFRELPEPIQKVEDLISETEESNHVLKIRRFIDGLKIRFKDLKEEQEDLNEKIKDPALPKEQRENLKKEIGRLRKKIRRVGKYLRIIKR